MVRKRRIVGAAGKERSNSESSEGDVGWKVQKEVQKEISRWGAL